MIEVTARLIVEVTEVMGQDITEKPATHFRIFQQLGDITPGQAAVILRAAADEMDSR